MKMNVTTVELRAPVHPTIFPIASPGLHDEAETDHSFPARNSLEGEPKIACMIQTLLTFPLLRTGGVLTAKVFVDNMKKSQLNITREQVSKLRSKAHQRMMYKSEAFEGARYVHKS
jgi:hypothetical protein